jgi:hypothetical protein
MDLTFVRGAFLSGIKVAGKDYSALVDTGAENSMLVVDDCIKLGLAAEGARKVTCVHGDRKELPMFSGDVEISGKTAKLSIVGMPRAISIPGFIVTAVAGRDLLGNLSLVMDFLGRTGEVN